VLRANVLQGLDGLVAAHDVDRLQAQVLRHLDDEDADGRVRGILDDPFAARQMGVAQEPPCGGRGDVGQRPHLHRHIVRNEPEAVGRHVDQRLPCAFVGHAHAAAGQRGVDVGPGRHDLAHALAAGGCGQLGQAAVTAADHPEVRGIHTGRKQSHLHLAGRGRGNLDLVHTEDVEGLAVFMVTDCLRNAHRVRKARL